MSQSHSATDSRLRAVPNPFSDAAVGSVWDSRSVDVPEIHAGVSETLRRLIDERADGHHHRCVMLYGDAGSGKTHVLRRLRMALEQGGEEATPFSWVRMQTSPSMMWRHIRRNFADDLSRRPFRGSTQLAQLIAARLDRIDSVEDRDLAVVLDHVAKGQFQRDARAWLAGAPLPDLALKSMGIALADTDEETSEDVSRRIVYALTGFLSPAPVVLCLDQLEALQSHPGDKNGLFAIGKLIAALHDDAPNVVVVGCVQTGLISSLASTLSKAETDRYQPTALRQLTAKEIRALVRARLDSRSELQALRPPGAPELWPIEVERLDPLVKSREGIGARKVIFECEQMFRAAQELPLDTSTLEDRLFQKFEEQVNAAAARLSAGSTSSILSDALPRLLHLRGVKTDRTDLPKWIDHICISPDGKHTAVVLANEGPRALWRKLDKVCLGWNPTARGLAIVRDTLNPLRATAAGSIDRLQELERRGARIVTPSREALIALDAARRLLADADSGDLTYRGEKVAIAGVEDWVRRHLSDPAGKLLDELAGPPRGDTGAGLRLALASFLAERKMSGVPDAVEQLHCTNQEVENCARQNSDQFGILAGPQPAVFERIPAVAGA